MPTTHAPHGGNGDLCSNRRGLERDMTAHLQSRNADEPNISLNFAHGEKHSESQH